VWYVLAVRNAKKEILVYMLVGINYPWIDYGWDFGDPPPAWVGDENLPAWRETKRKQIEEDFSQFAAQGIFAVRWFLLADGINYGMGQFAPQKTDENWTFDPLLAGHPFYSQLCDDFEFVMQVCRKNDLQFFPSLIDFHWCHQGTAIEGSPCIVRGGRHDIIRDPVKRRAFFERVLDPLLDSSAQYRDSIYAWELINEPEWVVRSMSPGGEEDGNRNVSQEEMMEFITEGIRRINMKRLPDGRGAFQSSVGFAHWESLNEWDSENLGITLHQFHYYAQENCDLPLHPHSENHPCIVGEFATAAGCDWPDLKNRHKDQTVTNRLCCVEDKGYPACFLWSARAIDLATQWTRGEHQEIVAYNSSNRFDGLRG